MMRWLLHAAVVAELERGMADCDEDSCASPSVTQNVSLRRSIPAKSHVKCSRSEHDIIELNGPYHGRSDVSKMWHPVIL